MKTILVTGGAGYIGSQTVLELDKAGYFPITYDNLSTGHRKAVLAGEFILGDLAEAKKLKKIFKRYQPDAVLHFAASIEVGESVRKPQKYFKNNITNSLNLLKAMLDNKVDKLIFSSSAAVYGNPKKVPIKEEDPTEPVNPYGLTKLLFEQILACYQKVYGLKSISLRYFNAAGADPSGKIGEATPEPTHLITRALLTALNRYPCLEIFGADYPTRDGTCIRDYIHVKDLAVGHILALKALEKKKFSIVYNLGTSQGYSVREVIETARKITGTDFKIKESSRRAGDPAILIASRQKAKKELGFRPKYSGLETIIKTAWEWHVRSAQAKK